ncbi:hypothetical protein CO2235_150101 [Cupriavidus oxalaticus]|uniref:Uncharacterized protein n=1 Tax=Cupriavidus oxalaticus TaxID=96344 RepID=A0A375FPA8_9BURK|nr:hypothetical protein CO2235_U600018 [Cupriavidus oxalaticus]SPC12446.1 hypothetical protein CO2235_150101 [Cupriavidus oxalaticus]
MCVPRRFRISKIKVRGRTQVAAIDSARGFSEGEWLLVRTIADGFGMVVLLERGRRAAPALHFRFRLRDRFSGRRSWLVPCWSISTRLSATTVGCTWSAKVGGLVR